MRMQLDKADPNWEAKRQSLIELKMFYEQPEMTVVCKPEFVQGFDQFALREFWVLDDMSS